MATGEDASVHSHDNPDLKDVFKVSPHTWQVQLLAWLVDKGSVAVVLACWLAWSIYDGAQRDRAKDKAEMMSTAWVEKFWDKVDNRLTQITNQQVLALEKALNALDRSTERLERKIEERKIK